MEKEGGGEEEEGEEHHRKKRGAGGGEEDHGEEEDDGCPAQDLPLRPRGSGRNMGLSVTLDLELANFS